VTGRGFRLQPLHGAVEWALQRQAKDDHHRQHQEGDPGEGTRDHEQYADEQDRK
jgi:hypothetical protein